MVQASLIMHKSPQPYSDRYQKAFPEERKMLCQQKGHQLCINYHDFGMANIIGVVGRCPHTFGNVVYSNNM